MRLDKLKLAAMKRHSANPGTERIAIDCDRVIEIIEVLEFYAAMAKVDRRTRRQTASIPVPYLLSRHL